MTTREKVDKLLDRLSAAELESEHVRLTQLVADSDEHSVVPERLRRFDSGRPQPDWAAVIRGSRTSH